ncbi:Ankyrin-3 [Araneus ventricosus]|uniref:Ankyrin-3 n=1 Tax=Araneus ventricosus TaxID=182803 RepID=A0A4Y2KBA5_ARAVE|nr:Ankyrin-3 [Araneus ventricosus]
MGGLLSLMEYLPLGWYRHLFGYTQKTFSFASKSIEQLVEEFISLDEVSGNYFYSQIISEIKDAVLNDDLDRFKVLSELLNYANIHKNCETLRNYRQTAYESTGNINLINLACKLCAVNVLSHLFSDDNCLYNLPFPIDKSVLSPEEEDEHHHNAFYYAIRSNNSNLLEILIDKWPNDCLKENSDKLDDILSKAYKDLITKNVYICKGMEILVKNKYVDLRFFHENTVQKKAVADRDDTQNLKDLTMLRIDFILESIAYVREHFWESDPNEMFILSTEYIAKNIHTLKAAIASSNKLLWEEIEFCLIIFIRSCLGRFQADPLYHFLLNKQRMLMHLGNFSDILITVKDQVRTAKINKFRKIVIKGIENLDIKPHFKALSDDFTQVRDLYTLETIRKSIKVAVCADVSQKNGQLLITRALQIIGEHLKNTLDSPKLSNATYELLLSTLPRNVKEIITDLRNCLSHAESLSSRSENEENVISFFASMQSDIEQLSIIIFDILRRKKAMIIGKVLDKIKDCESPSSIKLFFKQNHFSPYSFEGEVKETETLNIAYIEELERLIQELQSEVDKELSSAKELFHRIHDVTYKRYFYSGIDLSKSIDLYECSLPSNTKETIMIFRDSLLRINLKNAASESEAILQLTKIPMEVEKICSILNGIFVKNKLKATKSVLLRIKDCTNYSNIEKLLTQIQELEETNPINEEEIKESEKLILDLEIFSECALNSAKEMFRKIHWIIEEEKTRLDKVRNDFCNALRKFMKIAPLNDNDDGDFKTLMKSHISTTKTTFELLTMPSYMRIFSDKLSLVLRDIILQLVQGNCIRGERFKNALFNVYNFIEFHMGQIKGIKEFKQMLKPNKKHQGRKSRQKISKLDEGLGDQLSHKLSSLKTVINDFHFDKLSSEKVQSGEKDLMVQSLIEMFVLDVMSALECFPDRLAHNAYFLDTDYPVINGKNLRNHLAHGNALVSILLRGEFTNVLLNAKKLIETDDLLRTDRQIGKKIKNDPVKLKASLDGDLTSVSQQYELFLALTEGNMEKVKDCLGKGADLHGRDMNSQTSLHFAAKGSNLEMVKFVLKFYPDVNVKDDKLQTALHIAASNGRLFTMEYLLQDMKMPIDSRDANGKTPLHFASENGHLDVVKCLLEHDAETISKDLFGYAPLHYAVKGNYKDIVNLFLEKESNVDSNQAFYGISALHLASEKGHLDLVVILIEKKANVNCTSDMQFVPLHFAARKGHAEVVKLLIAKGASVNSRNIHKATPLHLAVENGFEEIVDILLYHGADANAIYLNGLTPLAVAARQGYSSIAKLLLEKDAVIDALTDFCQNPLDLAASFGHYELVKILMDKFKPDSKISALHEAALGGHRHIMELLVKEGVSIHEKWVRSEFSALHLAALEGHTDVLDFLIEHGFDIDTKAGGTQPEKVLSCKDQEYTDFVDSVIFKRSKSDTLIGNGQTALHLSSNRGHRDTVRSLLRNKANIQIKDNSGKTALRVIIEKDMTNILIEENIAVGLTDCGIYNPLQLGCVKGDLKFVQYCIKEGCDIEARTKLLNDTALHLAVMRGHAEVVKYLLDNGSNINAPTDNGATALAIAIEENKRDILDILMDRNAEFTSEDERKFMLTAITRGNEDIVGYLLSKNPKNGASNPKYDHYPLHTAVLFGHLNTIKKLIEELDKKEIDAKNKKSVTPLYIAADLDQCEIAKFLLSKGADPNAKSGGVNVPLHMAAVKGYSEMVKILLKEGADCSITDAHGTSSIEFAIRLKHPDIVKILLSHSKVDVNSYCCKGCSLLHLGAISGSLETVEYLVDLKADIDATDSLGAKPIHIAAREGYKDIVEYLSSLKFEIDDRGENGWTLLHYAAAGNHPDICEFLLRKGLDINIEDEHGHTPLHIAAEFGKTKVVQMLLYNGAYYDARSKRNETPLQIMSSENNGIIVSLTIISGLFAAVRNNDYSKSEVLLKEAEEFSKIGYANVKNEKCISLLHYAAWKGSEEIVELLLRFKANPNARAKDGSTSLHYASKFSHLSVVKTLLRHGAIFEPQNESNKTPLNYATDQNIILLLNFVQTTFSKVMSSETSLMEDLESITNLDTSKIVMKTMNIHGQKLTTTATLYKHPNAKGIKELFQNDVLVPLKMAEFFFEHGQYENSFKLYKIVLQKRVYLFGQDDPAVLDIRFKLSLIRFRQWNYNEAFDLAQNVYLRRKDIFDEFHEETLAAHSLLASILERNGQKEQALYIYEDVSNKLRSTLGPGHAETLKNLICLEHLLLIENKAEIAVKISDELIEKLDENFDVTLWNWDILLKLGKILRLMGMHSKALEIFDSVFEMQKIAFGLCHHETLKTILDIAETFLLKGDEKTSLVVFKKASYLHCSVLGPNHADSLHCRNCLANILFSQRKFCEALEIYQSDLQKRMEKFWEQMILKSFILNRESIS